ncbi:hypothetical protein [Novosphingobium sp.]|jgi:hypothetical protein|uniref:hypothetical protein n=1 Tax=Novosphingobium sp. TaxID=1874826 RepID=UPI002FE3ADBF
MERRLSAGRSSQPGLPSRFHGPGSQAPIEPNQQNSDRAYEFQTSLNIRPICKYVAARRMTKQTYRTWERELAVERRKRSRLL